MEITDKERLLFVKIKEEILELSKQTMDKLNGSSQALEVKKNIMSVLSKISTLTTYAQPTEKNAIKIMELDAQIIFKEMDMTGERWTAVRPDIEEFFNKANSIEFHFRKKGLEIKPLEQLHFHVEK